MSSTVISSDQKQAHDSLAETNAAGKYVRVASGYRNIISREPDAVFQPAFGRYHLFVNYACPWANRCIALVNMKGLHDCIKITTTHPTWQKTKPDDPTDTHHGWAFYDSASGVPLHSPTGHGNFVADGCDFSNVPEGVKFIRDLYELSHDTLHKYTVPVLWDNETQSIVNNESSEILRMLTCVFDEWATGDNTNLDLYPLALRADIDIVNEWVYTGINDGVYKCGFAKTQGAYEDAIAELYTCLDRVEAMLSSSRYLVGGNGSGDGVFTEADLRLFMTLVRFDEVYVVYFKCNVRRIADYPHMRNYLRDIYQMQGMARSIKMAHIKTHYFSAHPSLNTYSVIPVGPNVVADLQLPHDRDRAGK